VGTSLSVSRSPAARIYLDATIALGSAVVIFCGYRLIRHSTGYDPWLYAIGLTVLAARFNLKLPGVSSRVSIADMFVFLNLILFGPETAAITAALEGLVGTLACKKSPQRALYGAFNASSMAISSFCTGKTVFALLRFAPVHGNAAATFSGTAFAAFLVGVVYFLLNTGSVAAMVALDSGAGMWDVWLRNYFWLCNGYFLAAFAALLMALGLNPFMPTTFVTAGVVLSCLALSYNVILGRLAESVQTQAQRTTQRDMAAAS